MGEVPLIFVVHSMGGLIAKEAYMQGQNDPEFEGIIKAICAIIFLATPHRGSNFAEILNRILQSSIISNPKHYVSELAKNSFTLQKLNEQFRHIAPRLDIVSFYETQPCSVGLKNARIMVLEKDSSVLGYPGETSKALMADHHDVCKFESPNDPNYITVKNVLKSILSKILSTTKASRDAASHRRNSQDLRKLLAITDLPDNDYIFFRDQWRPGTNDWILRDSAYVEWSSPLQTSCLGRILWISGGAAAGKSVLASFIINRLIEQGHSCQYFFIRFGDKNKRSLSHLLRSIALQVAQAVAVYQESLVGLIDEGLNLAIARPSFIWDRLFKSILFQARHEQPLYWVIDGIDEADDPKATLRLLSDISTSQIPIRVIVIGRRTFEISSAFDRLPKEIASFHLSIEGHIEDLRSYIDQELDLSGGAEYRIDIIDRIVKNAQNNFLWVRLAVDNLNSCHSREAVDIAIHQLPIGMEALYDRMATKAASHASPMDQDLALSILELVTCSLRILTIVELSEALSEQAGNVFDFQKSIIDLCGGLVVIDSGGNVAVVHQTAREYLLGDVSRPFRIDRASAHKQIFLSCMRCLKTNGLRMRISRQQKPKFLDYAARFWSSHLISTSTGDCQVAGVLNSFLSRHWLLTWVHALAVDDQLRILIQASRHLSKCSARLKAHPSSNDSEATAILEQALIESLGIDLIKLAGKFGTVLRNNPEAIYKLIAPFCPKSSSIYQLFGKSEAKTLNVSGFSTETWDDCLGRLSLGYATYASAIAVSGAHILILDSSGRISMFESSTFQETAASPIKHGERIYRMELNSSGTLLATCGYRTTRIWDAKTGQCKSSVDSVESRPRPLTMLFTNSSSMLLVGFDDRRLRSLDITRELTDWQTVTELEEPELEGHFLNSASFMTINHDGSLIAVAYRGHPLSAWEIEGPMHIGHCWRTQDELARGQVIDALWHPLHTEVYGLYIEGTLFRWRPYDNDVEELNIGASKLAINKDGDLFATGDVHGTIKVYSAADFELLYQLASQDTVLGIAFGPEPSRFYDIRGSYGNAWEPNALVKFAEREERGSDAASETGSLAQTSCVSTSWSPRIESITTLVASPTTTLYCWGTDQGVVRLYDTRRAEVQNIHVSKSLMSIEVLTWSPDGRSIAFSDSSKKLFVMDVRASTGQLASTTNAKLELSLKAATKGPINQILFHPSGDHIMIFTTSSICVVSFEDQSVVAQMGTEEAGCRWLRHPLERNTIIGFSTSTVHAIDWKLKQILSTALRHDSADATSDAATLNPNNSVDHVVVTYDKKHLLVQISRRKQGPRDSFLLFVDTSSLPVSKPRELDDSAVQTPEPRPVEPRLLPSNISAEVLIPLAFLPRDRLVFLSTRFSICVFQVPPVSAKPSAIGPPKPAARPVQRVGAYTNSALASNVREIFPLPGDWIRRDCLALCSIWVKERSFLCPRNDEVAVVRCAALA